MSVPGDTTAPESGPAPALRVGPYRLIREIGRGGMGTVFLGVRDDDAFQKRVAIKVLKRGMDSDAIVRRFRNERQILAGLEHPFIASLLDGGTTADGLPYFAMEYVEGQTIVEYCESRQLDTTARLRLFRKVCTAVQYAHQNLIIHRDIKPANVLVTADGTPKLLDFGIAKLLNPDVAAHTLAPTVEGGPLMTPEYASPEQVRGEPVSTATDVYSLGVLLYELLTGRRPYRITSRTPAEIARVVCHAVPERPSTAVTTRYALADQDAIATGADADATPTRPMPPPAPPRPSVDTERLRRRLAGDLDNIVLKALSKEPSRRYVSVDQFSEDVRRHLEGLPVLARPDTIRYRAAKFARRNRAALSAAALIVLALVAGIIGTAWQARVASRERARAEQRFEEVRQLANAFIFELHDAIRDLPGSTPARRLLVTKGLQYLDRLASDAAGQHDLGRELAGAYVRVGDVQGRPFTPNLGDTAGALASYEKAVSLYEQLGAAASGDAALRRELATAYLRTSDALAALGRSGDALASAKKALALQSAEPLEPTDVEERQALAVSLTRVADLLSETGDTQAALDHRRQSLAHMEQVAALRPGDVDVAQRLGIAYQKLANTLGNPNYPNVGDLPGALAQLERAAAVLGEVSAAHPNNASLLRNVAVVASNQADVLFALGRADEALTKQREALASFEQLSAADPNNVAALNDVAISRSKIGELLDGTGRTQAALAEYEQSLAIHSLLAAGDPGNQRMQLEIASDHNRLATAQMKLGLREASLANHDRAVAIADRLSAANPDNVELQVAMALARMGRADARVRFAGPPSTSRGADELARAERDYAEAVSTLSRLAEAGAIAGTDRQTLTDAEAALAKVRRQRGLPTPAAAVTP